MEYMWREGAISVGCEWSVTSFLTVMRFQLLLTFFFLRSPCEIVWFLQHTFLRRFAEEISCFFCRNLLKFVAFCCIVLRWDLLKTFRACWAVMGYICLDEIAWFLAATFPTWWCLWFPDESSCFCEPWEISCDLLRAFLLLAPHEICSWDILLLCCIIL